MLSLGEYTFFHPKIRAAETHFTQDQGRHHDIRSQSGQVHGLQECHENLWSGLLCKVALVSHNTMWAIVLTCILPQHCSQGQNWSHLLQRARLSSGSASNNLHNTTPYPTRATGRGKATAGFFNNLFSETGGLVVIVFVIILIVAGAGLSAITVVSIYICRKRGCCRGEKNLTSHPESRR